jgi:hypothetical protein
VKQEEFRENRLDVATCATCDVGCAEQANHAFLDALARFAEVADEISYFAVLEIENDVPSALGGVDCRLDERLAQSLEGFT